MGLDMYLEADISLWSGNKDAERTKIRNVLEFAYGGLADTQNRWIGGKVTVPLAYWRKVNAVHAWFVKYVQDGVDDCGRYSVTLDQLKELKKLCQKAMSERDETVSKSLPTQEGFFFGETEYDDYYFEQLKYTLDVIDRIERLLPTDSEIYYQSSW